MLPIWVLVVVICAPVQSNCTAVAMPRLYTSIEDCGRDDDANQRRKVAGAKRRGGWSGGVSNLRG